LGGLLQRVYF